MKGAGEYMWLLVTCGTVSLITGAGVASGLPWWLFAAAYGVLILTVAVIAGLVAIVRAK